ncbi:MAG: hypothetical protein LAO09_02210 [Acidobacteriia bacterium]|nr:hypothetical protein [Terriglobia bacterium]
MSINISNDKNIPTDAEACYETVASQEEIYLEETEEELRAILIFDDPSPSPREVEKAMCDANNDPRIAAGLDEQLNHAAEELITGDSDDPPLSEDAVVEMLRMALNARGLGHSSDA